MKIRIISIMLAGLILLALCSCGKFIFSEYKSGDVIESTIDGNTYKLNSKFVMFDDGGSLNDSIVRINGV
ncbi:MAG: hypothetical protein J1E41_04495, partial [Ruminococcus sp.]|nr:hypothetical protein [Ruminococcus sp.]